MNTHNVDAAAAGPRRRQAPRAMRRLAIAAAAACVLATLGATVAGAAGPKANPNAGFVDFTCDNGAQRIWVNYLASDLSGGGAPAIVVDGNAGRVFKVLSWSVAGYSGTTRYPGPPPFEAVECTHDSPDGTVTLTGVFIP